MFKNKQRENVFCRECEKLSPKKKENDFANYYNAWMVIFLLNKKHMIGGKVPMHNHAPEVNCLIIEIAIENINDKVRLTKEKPS